MKNVHLTCNAIIMPKHHFYKTGQCCRLQAPTSDAPVITRESLARSSPSGPVLWTLIELSTFFFLSSCFRWPRMHILSQVNLDRRKRLQCSNTASHGLLILELTDIPCQSERVAAQRWGTSDRKKKMSSVLERTIANPIARTVNAIKNHVWQCGSTRGNKYRTALFEQNSEMARGRHLGRSARRISKRSASSVDRR